VGQADRNSPDRSARLVRLRSRDTPGDDRKDRADSGSREATAVSSTAESVTPVGSAVTGRQLGLGTMHSTEERRRPVVLVGKGVCYDTGGEPLLD
jgi:hypothetical protein